MMGEVIRVSGRAPDVGEFLKEAMLSQRFADVALCCPGGQRFLAHRLVLSAASPYLQEVLLAHSKSSTHCEPITVILAEVEAPELAAILGFVYTGTTTVPRPRLNAFLHAAETLHIRLPPVPVVMTCSQPDCKQEDVKDVKISPKYLQCDQYPCWCRPGDQDGDSTGKRDPYRGIESLETAREIGPLPESMNFAGSRLGPNRYCSATWPVPPFTSQEKSVHTVDQCADKVALGRMDVRGYHPISLLPRIDRIDQANARNMENLRNGCESSVKPREEEYRFTRSPYDLHGQLDPLELRMRTDQGVTRIGEDEILRRDTKTREGTVEEERTEERLSVIHPRNGACQDKTSLVLPGRRYERPEYGEDLTCGDGCFNWKVPRRHVANRVIASPWRQTIRPHHLPKLQPIVLQPPVDDVEVEGKLPAPEAGRQIVTSSSPDRQFPKNPTPTDRYYNLEVPATREAAYDNTRIPEVAPGSLQEFYPPQIPFIPSQPVPSVNPDVRTTETLLQPPNDVATRPLSTCSDGLEASADRKGGYFGQAFSLPAQRPEISHPVSRLCDTIESNDNGDPFASVEAERAEEEVKIEDKLIERVTINSDSNNNNDVVVGNEVPPRGRSTGAQEDHRCDQCGKTFVTRASLKVHIRTHSGEKPFRCADCGKQFSQLRNYKYHRSVHEGTREFAATCPECGKYFNDRGYLSSHMKIHRNRKEYGCAECGKSFNQRVAYNMHVRIHTGVKPHQCEQCGKAFSRKMLLKQHLRTHSGERPYQCQVCQKAFADRSNMTLHTRLHSGLKPYQCTLCSKAFTKKHHLKTHLNYHTGTKPYSCPNCGLRFSQSSNMRTHFKKCTVSNPGEAKNSQAEGTMESTKLVQGRMISRTPTDTLTPPNSDQELSILTPICKTNGIEGSGT